MGKHDMPSLQFKVENGRLVPAGPYEAEVLDTYQRGSELTVTLHQKRTLPLLKKYWAVLRDVVSNCKTPWNSPDEASDALKLALGVTDIGKTVTGQWFIRAGSISFTSMDQAAFKEFFDKAMAVLAKVTGIDPESLSVRYRHIPEHEPSDQSPQGSDAAVDNPVDGEGSGGSPQGAAPENSVQAEQSEAGGQPSETTNEAHGESSTLPVSETNPEYSRARCIEKMLAIAANEKDYPDRQERLDLLAERADMWLAHHDKSFVNPVFERCKAVIKGENDAAAARRYLETL